MSITYLTSNRRQVSVSEQVMCTFRDLAKEIQRSKLEGGEIGGGARSRSLTAEAPGADPPGDDVAAAAAAPRSGSVYSSYLIAPRLTRVRELARIGYPSRLEMIETLQDLPAADRARVIGFAYYRGRDEDLRRRPDSTAIGRLFLRGPPVKNDFGFYNIEKLRLFILACDK